jgi:hypothetical protein
MGHALFSAADAKAAATTSKRAVDLIFVISIK